MAELHQKWRIAIAAAFMAVVCSPVFASTLLIGNKGEDSVSFVDLASGKQCARIATGKAPHEIAISPNDKQAAVVAYGGTSVDILDIGRNRLTKRIDIAPNAGPHGIVWLDGHRIAIAADRSNTLVLVDPRNGRFQSVATGQSGSHMLVVSPDKKLAYVPNILSGTVSIIDLKKVEKIGDIVVGGNPEGAAITPDGKYLWVGDNGKAQVRVVDLETQKTIANLPSDSAAFRVGISPDGKSAVTSNLMSGTINLFDVETRTPLRSIKISGSPKAMQVTIAFSADSKILYLAETGLDTIAEVDLKSGSVLRRIAAGRDGDGLGISPVQCKLGTTANVSS